MLVVNSLNAGYEKLQVLYDVDFFVGEKEIVAVVGPNGSGKSTLLKSIFGLTSVYSGSIKLNGEELTKLPPHEVARRGVVYLPQVDNVFSNLTVKENLLMAAYTLRRRDLAKELDRTFNFFPLLKECLNRKACTLSGGERQMLAMAMSLFRKPRLIMFDEPTANLAPKITSEVFEYIKRLKEELGISIVLVEQNAKKALEISDRAYLLVGGRVLYEGKSQELLSERRLGRIYLGIES